MTGIQKYYIFPVIPSTTNTIIDAGRKRNINKAKIMSKLDLYLFNSYTNYCIISFEPN